MRLDQSIDARLTEATERFRTGQISAVVSNKITVVTTGGASVTVPRLATWTPAIGDIVVLALTPAGWIALGKIA
jgi:hypothetical protein